MGKGKMYIAQDIQDLVDQVVSMHGRAPQFKDLTGLMPYMDINYRFRQFNEGLAANRATLGEERFHALMNLSNKAQTFFEADGAAEPENTIKGREIFVEMFNTLRPDGNMTED